MYIRWGADPFMFLAATLLLDEARILHFDDVPYLHQASRQSVSLTHLVAQEASHSMA